MRYIPNIISLLRIPLSLSLLLFVYESLVFLALYSLCGISDILDGYIARKMSLQSTWGAKLDSIADFTMYAVVIVVLCLWDFSTVIDFMSFLVPVALLRGVNIGIMYYKFHQFATIHTIGNKIVGLLVYSIPFIYIFMGSFSFLWFILPLLIIVPLEETCMILQMKKLNLDRRGLFFPEHTVARKQTTLQNNRL